MVREVRFELTTSCSQSRRATGLRYTLTRLHFSRFIHDFGCIRHSALNSLFKRLS